MAAAATTQRPVTSSRLLSLCQNDQPALHAGMPAAAVLGASDIERTGPVCHELYGDRRAALRNRGFQAERFDREAVTAVGGVKAKPHAVPLHNCDGRGFELEPRCDDVDRLDGFAVATFHLSRPRSGRHRAENEEKYRHVAFQEWSDPAGREGRG